MAWSPINFIVPQYVDSNGTPYSGAVLKAYAAGTSTPISLATDSTGGTTAASIALNANGYPAVSGNIVLPHAAQTYKLALYPTQAAADANSGAIWTIDNHGVLAAFGGSSLIGFIQSGASSAASTVQAKLRSYAASPLDKGGVGDGTTDDTVALRAAIDEHTHVDLGGKSWRITSKIRVANSTFKGMYNGTIICDLPGLASIDWALDASTNSIACTLEDVTFIPATYATASSNASRTGNLTFNYHQYQCGATLYEGSKVLRCAFKHLDRALSITGAIADIDEHTIVDKCFFTENAVTTTLSLLGSLQFTNNKGYLGSEATISSLRSLQVIGNEMFMPGTPAIDIGGSAAVPATSIVIADNISYGRDPIVVEGGGYDITIANNLCYVTADAPLGVGVGVTAGSSGTQEIDKLTIIGNQIIHYGGTVTANAHAYGIKVEATQNVTVKHINIHGNAMRAIGGCTYGVYLLGYSTGSRATYFDIQNNSVVECTNGIYVGNGDVGYIANNNLKTTNNPSAGITLSITTNTTIGANKTSGFVTAHYKFLGALSGISWYSPMHDAASEANLYKFDSTPTGNILARDIRVLAAFITPTVGNWDRGSTFVCTDISATGVLINACTVAGTSGTWKGIQVAA